MEASANANIDTVQTARRNNRLLHCLLHLCNKFRNKALLQPAPDAPH